MQRILPDVSDIRTVDFYAAGSRIIVTGNQFDKSRFAAAGMPYQPDLFAGFNRQIQIFEKIFPAGVGKGNAGKFYFSLDRAEIGGVGTVLQPRFYRQRVQRRLELAVNTHDIAVNPSQLKNHAGNHRKQ